MSIEIGDIVILKSGGPRMTVHVIYEGEVDCDWFDGVEHMYATFAEQQLIVEKAV